jgi:catechol 2,3-dioxygenase-like lactoylglutathione lyase family enzyme
LERSKRFYIDVLGFQLDWMGDVICSVSMNGSSIMLSQIEPWKSAAWVWIGLEDDSLFETYRAGGVKVRQEPQNHSWAYEMKFEDPDGNVLWLGTETRADLPLDD